MTPDNQSKARLLIARQLALILGYVWDRLDAKRQRELLTHATNILATVERLS